MVKKEMFKRAYIEITNICNLKCSFCPGTERKKRFMSPGEFRITAEKLRSYTDYIYLHVMGEPLMHPQLGTILDIASELGYKTNVTTNGTLLRERGDVLLAHPDIRKVSISLHSFEGNAPGGAVRSASDNVAGSTPGGAAGSAPDNVAGSTLGGAVRSAPDSLQAYLEDVWDFCKRAECIVALRLWNEGGENALNDKIMSFLSDKTGLDVPNLPADANGRRLGGKKYLESAEKFIWPSTTAVEQEVTFCHGLSQQIAVLCDGTVVPCCLDGEGAVKLGNIFIQSIAEIIEAPRAKALKQSFINHAPCEELCRRCDYAKRF